jgi:transposase-like protein
MALSHGVNANLLRKWISQYADAKATLTASQSPKASVAVLLPVMALAPQTKSAPVSAADSCIEIMCAAAMVRIRGAVDARALGVVLDCLAQRA